MADDPVAQLYGLPLNEFVPARDALARELRKTGDREQAAGVAKLKRPSVAAWAVNQLARRNRKELDLLLDAGHRLRTGQLDALEGGDRSKFEQARRDHERAIRELVAAARDILAGERGASSDQMLSSIERTLRYASIDEEQRPALASGRLVNEVEATGFDALAGMALPATPPPSRPAAKREKHGGAGDAAKERRERVAAAQEALKLARERERDARKRVREAERAERAAARELERASGELGKARDELDAAATEAGEAAARVEAERSG
jgi:hypothetical protein